MMKQAVKFVILTLNYHLEDTSVNIVVAIFVKDAVEHMEIIIMQAILILIKTIVYANFAFLYYIIYIVQNVSLIIYTSPIPTK